MVENNNESKIEKCYCPHLIEEEWKNKELDWAGKKFYRATYRCWFYVPNEDIGDKIFDAYKAITEKGYGLIPYGMTLSKNGIFQGETLLQIKNGEIDDPAVKTFRGKVYSKIYIGPSKDLQKVARTFDFKPVNLYKINYTCSVCTPDPNEQITVLIAEKKYY